MANTNGWTPPQLKMAYSNIDTLLINDNGSSFNYDGGVFFRLMHQLLLTVISPSGRETRYDIRWGDRRPQDTIHNIPITEPGEYKLRFYLYWEEINYEVIQAVSTSHGITMESYIYIGDTKQSQVEPYTISKAIDRLLKVTPLRTIGEEPVFQFDQQQLQGYNEESPEFSFSGNTLFEALYIIAGYKGAFPELVNWNTIRFRKMWNGIRIGESELPLPIEEVASSDGTQYCTFIDSEVSNLVGINDSQVGSITEPFYNGWKTTRAAEGSAISQDTAVITTEYPIYLITDERIGHIGDTLLTNKEQDITAYLYEDSDYQALSDTSAAYPNSKAYALRWRQFEPNITELSHRINGSNSIAQAFKEPAMANIIQAATGEDYDTGVVQFIKQLIGVQNNYGFADLMFRTTYIPIIDARVRQYKSYFGEFNNEGSIKYNQSAELVDSEMYGQHIKEMVRKLGNATKRKIYIFESVDDVPKVGTVVYDEEGEDWSVYDVAMTITENRCVATISYVKYAELSRFVGVKNPWKDSDVSTTKWQKRYVHYDEFILYTHDETRTGDSTSWKPMPTYNALLNILPATSAYPITAVKARGQMPAYDVEGNEVEDEIGADLNTVLLPVVSLAFGNSILFHWKYKNATTAGYQSEEAPSGATSVLSGTRYNRANKAVLYTDSLGRMETYNFYLMATGLTSSAVNSVREIANKLPLYPSGVGNEGYTLFGVNDLVIKKNSSEGLIFDVQIHNYTDDKYINIGSGLTNFCPLIGGLAVSLGVYGFTERLNVFDRFISISNATYLGTITRVDDSQNNRMILILPQGINGDIDGAPILSWAWVGENKNGKYQVILSENKRLDGSDFETTIYAVAMKNHD